MPCSTRHAARSSHSVQGRGISLTGGMLLPSQEYIIDHRKIPGFLVDREGKSPNGKIDRRNPSRVLTMFWQFWNSAAYFWLMVQMYKLWSKKETERRQYLKFKTELTYHQNSMLVSPNSTSNLLNQNLSTAINPTYCIIIPVTLLLLIYFFCLTKIFWAPTMCPT